MMDTRIDCIKLSIVAVLALLASSSETDHHVPHYSRTDQHGVWCVAKPTAPDSVLQKGLDYACSNSADCVSIGLSGWCSEPDNMVSHASFAFNSYWQGVKKAGGTCDFAASAMLVIDDPSYGFCNYTFS